MTAALVASGRKRAMLACHVRNRHLCGAIDQWAFRALHTSPGTRMLYDQRRTAGDLPHEALAAYVTKPTTTKTQLEHTARTTPISKPLDDNLQAWDVQAGPS